MAVLDSSFLIDILRNNKKALELLDDLERKEQALFITAPTVMELWEGALQSNILEREKGHVEELLAAMTFLPLDIRASKRTAEIEVDLSRKGVSIEAEDIMIAGIALSNGEMVVTKDTHYTFIVGLRVLKY